jgi:hypothetical protein
MLSIPQSPEAIFSLKRARPAAQPLTQRTMVDVAYTRTTTIIQSLSMFDGFAMRVMERNTGAMSETKQITGVSQGVTEKASGWTEFAIDIGQQYPVKVSTKIQEIIEMGRAATLASELATWTYDESDGNPNPHKPGTFYKNRTLSKVEVGGAVENPPNASAGSAAPSTASGNASSDGMSKEEWARKDSAIHMMAAIKTAADALKHTIPSDPTPEDLTKYLERCKRLSWDWWKRADAVRAGDDSDLPFPSEHDDSLPF